MATGDFLLETKASYIKFKRIAREYGINTEPLDVVRPWVLDNCFAVGKCYSVENDLGYAELADIQTIPDAMNALKECYLNCTTMETEKKTKKAQENFNRDAGGRVGKGFYKYALKAYYLTLQ
jgi:hypothetical protein